MNGGREQVGDPLAERTWLVRLCTRFTGDVDVAEDLPQETLLEAW
jgi:DNA-directed RNA polymerase specialized sigma24 family protein